MHISETGLALIRQFEGLRLEAYPDPGTGGAPWTIGFGTTKGVTPGMVITADRAEEMLQEDLRIFEAAVNGAVKVRICQHMFDALVSLVYNIGVTAFRDSTLLRKLNAGDYDGAGMEFERWVFAGGRKLAGLVRRRAAERALFEGKSPCA